MDDQTDELADLRDEIDRIDDQVGELIAERLRIAETVAAVKSNAGADIVDRNREAAVKSHYEDRFRQAGLEAETGSQFAEAVIQLSIDREEQVLADS